MASPLRLTKDLLGICPFLGLLANRTVSPVRGLIPGSMGMGGAVLSMGANGEALRSPTWASRGILHVIMFHKGWNMYARLVGMDAPREFPKLRLCNPDMKMARRHARRWHSEETELHEVVRSVPYVVVDKRDYVAPGDIPPYPSNPQRPGSRPFRDWPFPDDKAGPRWTVESVRDGYVSKEGKGRPKPHPGLQAREKKCTVGTVMTNIGKAPQAFSGGPLIESGKDNFKVGNWVS